MSQTMVSKLFSLELLLCAPEDKILRVQTLRLSNVISFTCICNCEDKFATFKEVQNHMNVAHPEWGGIYVKSSQPKFESVDNIDEKQPGAPSEKQMGNSRESDDEQPIASVESDTDTMERSENDADSNQIEIKVDKNEGWTDAMIGTAEKDLNGVPYHDADGVKKTRKKRPTSGDFACIHCPKTFPSEMGLNNHLRMHMNEGSYLCTECSAQFTNRRALEEHALQHPGYKPFVCTICKTSVIRFKSLVKHFKKKHGQAVYHCVLLQHKRMKSGCEECKHCGKSFQQSTEPEDETGKLSSSGNNETSIDESESLINSDCLNIVEVTEDSGDADCVGSNYEELCVTDSGSCNDTLGTTAPDKAVCNISKDTGVIELIAVGKVLDGEKVEAISSIMSCGADKSAGFFGEHLETSGTSGDRNGTADSTSGIIVSANESGSIRVSEASSAESRKGDLKAVTHEWNIKNDTFVVDPDGVPNDSGSDVGDRGVESEAGSSDKNIALNALISRMDTIDTDHDYIVRNKDGIGIQSRDIPPSQSERRAGSDGDKSIKDVLRRSKKNKSVPVSCPVCSMVFCSNHSLGNHMRVHTDNMTYKCAICSDTFMNRMDLEIHIKIHPGYTPFICTKCGLSYSLSRSLQKHMKAKHNSSVYERKIVTNQDIQHLEKKGNLDKSIIYQCSECFKKFLTHQGLAHHAVLHPWYKSIKDKPFKCIECEDMFVFASELEEHVSDRHPGFQPFNCYLCESTFCSRVKFQEHHKTHPAELFVCSVCQKTYKTGALLRKHVLRHTRPFRCSQCDKNFASPTSLRDHITVHSEVKAVECDICDSRFRTMRRYKAHRKTHLDDRKFICRMCNKGFNHKYALTIHLRCHTMKKDKPHQCSICQKRFVKPYLLQLHKRSHTGEKPFFCHICGATFVGSGSMRRHMRRHNGEFLYQCDRCGKGCIDHCSLKRHYRSHNKQKPHQCKICGKAFQMSISMTRCMKMHGSERIHCRVCDKGFVLDNELRRHMKMKHS